jgi:hypothetical protein
VTSEGPLNEAGDQAGGDSGKNAIVMCGKHAQFHEHVVISVLIYGPYVEKNATPQPS